jgi:hypothetical protein
MMTGSFVLASIQPRRTRRHGDATLCVPPPSITANSKYRSNGGAVFIGRHSISGRHSKINLVYPNSDLSTGFPWAHLGDTAVHEAEAAHRGSGQPIPGSPLGPTGPVPAEPDFEQVIFSMGIPMLLRGSGMRWRRNETPFRYRAPFCSRPRHRLQNGDLKAAAAARLDAAVCPAIAG